MKYEWRKKEKAIYLPKTNPEIIELEAANYITISGEGNPNSPSFAKDIGSLYALSYAIKMSYKGEIKIPGFYDYTVFPLEGEWDFNEEGRNKYNQGENVVDLKNFLVYKIMIKQPEFVTEEVFEKFKELAHKKKKDDNILLVKYEVIKEGTCAQMMHMGSYDDEPASFKRMEEYVESIGLKRASKQHKEIYISDPKKTAPEKMKTVLRFKVIR